MSKPLFKATRVEAEGKLGTEELIRLMDQTPVGFSAEKAELCRSYLTHINVTLPLQQAQEKRVEPLNNRAKVNGQDAALAAMIVKLEGTELRHDLEGLGIDALGELGILYEDSPHLRDHGAWQNDYMHYLGLIIGGGTSQIQKNIISERGLGMPREPKTQ